jgi:predicted GH43/DUF377 family glycosyl hydrolase
MLNKEPKLKSLLLLLLLMIHAIASAQQVIPAQPPGKLVDKTTMTQIYEEVKTPYKYGLLVIGQGDKKTDCPSVFRYKNRWYMIYIVFDGTGYETKLAVSKDLLNWKQLGTILGFSKGRWDDLQKAGFIALTNYRWKGSYKPEKYRGKYWMSYVGGKLSGYETDPLSIGVSWSKHPDRPEEWNKFSSPVLAPDQPDARYFEKLTLYKSNIIHDKKKSLGYPFVMFYNAKTQSGYERIGMAVSENMEKWLHYGNEPVIDNGSGISGDPQIIRIGEVWVMFYFGAFWCPDVSDTFACSYDLVNWTKWDGPTLISPSEEWDKIFAHKPWLVRYKGIVYHFYCAVNDNHRGIAVATSKDLGSSSLRFPER